MPQQCSRPGCFEPAMMLDENGEHVCETCGFEFEDTSDLTDHEPGELRPQHQT